MPHTRSTRSSDRSLICWEWWDTCHVWEHGWTNGAGKWTPLWAGPWWTDCPSHGHREHQHIERPLMYRDRDVSISLMRAVMSWCSSALEHVLRGLKWAVAFKANQTVPRKRYIDINLLESKQNMDNLPEVNVCRKFRHVCIIPLIKCCMFRASLYP